MLSRNLETSAMGSNAGACDNEPFTQQDQAQNEPLPGAHFINEPILLDHEHQKLKAPVDPLTRMPLPVLPPADIPHSGSKESVNWHHHYHPSNDKLLTSINGLAVRHVRLQLLPEVSYHNKYHSIFKGPEELPRTNEARFGHIVLACAGYVPGLAIDVNSDNPIEAVELDPSLRQRLQSSGELEVRGSSNIATFIKKHLVRQDFSHVSETVIEEFLTTRDLDRRWFLGHWLLAIASEIALEPVNPIYRQALNEGLIHKPTKKLPNIVKSYVNGRKTSHKAIKSLHKQLARTRT